MRNGEAWGMRMWVAIAMATMALVMGVAACDNEFDSTTTTTGFMSSSSRTSSGIGAGTPEPCGGMCADATPACDVETNTCVACSAEDATICAAGETCDLEEHVCVLVGPETLEPCERCTNDLQCPSTHLCAPMNYDGDFRGHYCLEDLVAIGVPPDYCFPPFRRDDKTTINGVESEVCTLHNEELTTCEAATALIEHWYCSGTDGSCSEDEDGAEFAVPGAICRPMAGRLRCTYPCEMDTDCLRTGSLGSVCGDGPDGSTYPLYCGGV